MNHSNKKMCGYKSNIDNDCGTKHGIELEINDSKLIRAQLGQYFFENNNSVIFKEEHITKYLGKVLKFRSPITCNSKNFNVCRKCIGDYEVIKKNENSQDY